jgi:cell wall-associated NlpC family hydrolase
VAARPAMSTGLKRSATAVAAGLLAGGLIITVGPTAGAAPKPTLSEVQAKLQKLTNQEQVLDQRYDQMKQDLSQANQRLKLVNQETARYKAKFETMRKQVARIAAQAYENGQLTSVAALLTSDDPQSVLDQGSILMELSSANSAQMTEFINAARQLESAQQAAKNAKAAIITLQARLNGQRTVLVNTIDQQKKLLAQLTPVQQAPVGPGGGNGGGGGTPPPVYKGPTNTQAEKVVAFVYAQIGKPYVFGASGPDSYDCSGLTSAAWASVGISIPRTSEEQWAGLPHVPTSDMQPGDILVFNGAGHVGIYVGGGMMIDAPHTGLDVQKVALAGWYASTLDGVVRP